MTICAVFTICVAERAHVHVFVWLHSYMLQLAVRHQRHDLGSCSASSVGLKKGERETKDRGEKQPAAWELFSLSSQSDCRTAVVPFGCYVCSQVICSQKNNKKALNNTPSPQILQVTCNFLFISTSRRGPCLTSANVPEGLSEKWAVTQPNWTSLPYDL